MVFDCAAEHQGTSLNHQLLRGPDYLNSLVGVLSRFREHSIALVADIEAMFHQVQVIKKDTYRLGFLWWPDDDYSKDPIDFQMLVHLFGAKSSPSCAMFALRRTALDNQNHYDAETVRTVLHNFYVDDCLKSVEDPEFAARLVAQLCQLLSCGGFHLTKWLSNDRDILSAIPEEERASSVKDLDLEELPLKRTLGIQWDIDKDSFTFHVKLKQKPETRRGILSMVSSLYDPLGFLAPCILLAKLILQELCRHGVSWDEMVDDRTAEQWREWVIELPHLSTAAIPRCFIPESFTVERLELHTFCDASIRAYAAVSYLRAVGFDGRIHCAVVLGKSRLSPLKTTTIPRLELSAAVLAARLSKRVIEELTVCISTVVFWSDSTSVLQYICNESRRFHTFVANRVAEIQRLSDASQWRYVPSGQNPADEGSRGQTASEFLQNDIWIKGPAFLWKDETYWPEPPEALKKTESEVQLELQKDPEVRHVNTITIAVEVDSTPLGKLVQAFSSWTKLKTAVAWLLLYKDWLRQKVQPMGHTSLSSNPILTVTELRKAEIEIVRIAQKESFAAEIKSLDQGKNGVPGRLRKLCPVLQDGVLRVGGRLRNAPTSTDFKQPVILPSNHHVTKLLIRYHHELVGHSGAGMTWSSLRRRFWILKGGAAVRRVLGNCFSCKRRNAALGEQLMGELPAARVTPEQPPFSNTGVDYFGYILVKQGRSHVKRYGCLFTCLASRAVHIEVAHFLNTDSFLNALRRFMNRRGAPTAIFSDNGSNFVAGERELREGVRNFSQEKIQRYLHQIEIEWHFNPPLASHMGGIWERMVRSVKKILKVLLKNQVVTDEVLQTLLTEVEGILNSRPITQVSQDSRDLEPLTPKHLLLLRPNSCLPPDVFTDADSYGARSWRQAQYLANQFWRRWLREYLPLLQLRQKWMTPRRSLKEGDLVLVADENAPRGEWPLGRVVQTYPDRIGRVRYVDVRVGMKNLRRPITKLCFLESVQ